MGPKAGLPRPQDRAPGRPNPRPKLETDSAPRDPSTQAKLGTDSDPQIRPCPLACLRERAGISDRLIRPRVAGGSGFLGPESGFRLGRGVELPGARSSAPESLAFWARMMTGTPHTHTPRHTSQCVVGGGWCLPYRVLCKVCCVLCAVGRELWGHTPHPSHKHTTHLGPHRSPEPVQCNPELA